MSFLAAPGINEPIDSIEGVVESQLQVKSFGGVVKNTLYKSEDPLILALDKKYSLHSNFHEAFVNVTKRKVILIESKQMSEYRIKKDFTDK